MRQHNPGYGLLALILMFEAGLYGQAPVPQGTPDQIATIKTLEQRALASPLTGSVGRDIMRAFGYDGTCSVPVHPATLTRATPAAEDIGTR